MALSSSALVNPAASPAADHLAIALDLPSAADALALAARLGGSVRWFKVGYQLFFAAGGGFIAELKRLGYSVFLDLKLHDIPNTVAAAVRALGAMEPDLLTVHAAGGPAMLRAAREAAESLHAPLRLLAVTVLTSMDAQQLRAIGIRSAPAGQVLRLAEMAAGAGITGLVASAQEAAALRRQLGPETLLVTPGIRPSGSGAGDQKRVATPASALAAGADLLVVGRPVTEAADPAAAAAAILAEIAAELHSR